MEFPDALRQPVTDLPSARAWIEALHAARLAFHFDDDPSDCLRAYEFTEEQYEVIGARRDALYRFEWGPRPGLGMWYCPIGYLLRIEALAGELPGSGEREPFGSVTICDRGDDADYDYGAPGRFEVSEAGALLGRFDCYADIAAARPDLKAHPHFALCLSLETRELGR